MAKKIEVKITAKDQDGNVLYETEGKEDEAWSWNVAVLWSGGLETAIVDNAKMEGVKTLTITAERVQTDATPPEPIITQEDEDEAEDNDPDPFDDDGDEEDNPVTTTKVEVNEEIAMMRDGGDEDRTLEGPASVATNPAGGAA